ncbi:YihY family inner membrane protein [Arenibaculum pallidiluteum]|uniref:YihY family inner membrane protein n=1 Tax=Arenibaculum pallidiluteum TaxID=2812559 RepID=UPI001A9794FD|nr:YihY family inner membrane protein [Arenibaculum pallidiluteum]
MRLGVDMLPEGLSRIERAPRVIWSFLSYLTRRFIADDCLTTASALTYTALLAIVPLMTIFFAVFQAFPAYGTLREHAQKLLVSSLVPEVGEAILDYLNTFTANAGQLTGFGVIGLAVTAVLLFNTIEGSFRMIWRVTDPRSIVVRLLAFWTILTLTPLLFGASLSLSSTLYATLHLDSVVGSRWFGWAVILPGLFETFGFFLLYLLIPSREIRWQDALYGAVTASVLLETSKALFGWYVAAFPTYQTIYGALSVVPIFLLWLYIAWSTVLVGAEVAAALPEWRAGIRSQIGPEGLLSAHRVVVALAILRELLEASQLGVGMRRRTLVGRVPVGAAVVDGILEQLQQVHWVARTRQGAWVYTRDLSECTLYDLLRSLGIGMRGNLGSFRTLQAPWLERATRLLEQADDLGRDALGVPLKELLCGPDARELEVRHDLAARIGRR